MFSSRWIALLSLACGAALSPARAAELRPGATAPPIGLEKLLQAPEGAAATWDSLRGKVVVLEFWATWCGPCIAEIPKMNKLVESFKDKPVQFISITDEAESIIEPFLKRKTMRPWIGLDLDQSMMEAYQVFSIPYSLVVDGKGQIAAILHPAQLNEGILNDVLAGKPVTLR